ncbi:MAG: carotenoid 1,2-hydratase, partial [Gammaproteobacteria bacterium]|nr:carotenoid 1,2-hydratase [Gammaproteobacteria bacterium]
LAQGVITLVRGGAPRLAWGGAGPGPGLAGVVAAPFSAWLQDWQLASTQAAFLPLRLDAHAESLGAELEFAPGRGPVLQGDAGYSRKGRAPGNASHYFSYTRLPVSGRLYWEGEAIEVSGLAWLDREWGSSALDPDVVGWDWLSLRLEDGRDLMVFRLRERNGGTAPWSAGTLVNPDGETRRTGYSEFEMQPERHWVSPATGRRYPVQWQLLIPGEGLALSVSAVIPNQEMRTRVRYWEGLVDARDEHGKRVGEGYLELTGY